MKKVSVLFSILILWMGKAPGQELTLQFYLDASKQHSAVLNDYNNRVLTYKLDSLRLRAALRPQIDFNANGSYAPIIDGYGYDEALSNGQVLTGLFSISYSITGNTARKTQLALLNNGRDSTHLVSKIAGLDLERSITEQYILAFASQQQVRFNKEVLDLLKKEEALLKSLTRSNAYKQTDYLTFLVALKQQELQLKQSSIQFESDFSTLNYLTGIRDTVIKPLADPHITLAEAITEGGSVFYKQFTIDSLRLENERTMVKINYRPKVNLYADGGYSSSFMLPPYRNWGASVRFSVNVPIYDGHQRKLAFGRLSIEENTRIRYKTFFSSQYKQQTATLQRQISETEALYRQISEQLRYVKGLIFVNNKLLQTGEVTIADYVIALNNYLGVQNLLAQTTVSRLRLMNQLNYWNR